MDVTVKKSLKSDLIGAVIITLLSTCTFGINGLLKEECPETEIVDLTVNSSDSLASLRKYGTDRFPPNATWSINGKVFGCLCDLGTCLTLCCSLHMARFQGDCVEDNATSDFLPGIRTSIDNKTEIDNVPLKTSYLSIDQPCDLGWMQPSLLDNFSLLQDGSIFDPNKEGRNRWEFGYYCLFREPKSSNYLAKVCHILPERSYMQITVVMIACLFMTATFIGYTIVPELKNFHGFIFRCYIATHISLHICELSTQATTESRTYANVFSFFRFCAVNCAVSCAFWLNVMSFNIWRAFRGLSSVDPNGRKRGRKRFFWYAMYAWLLPLAMTSTWTAVNYLVPQFHSDTIDVNLRWSIIIGLLTVVLIANAIMYISTALTIRRHKQDTAHLTSGVNKHHEVDKQWFNLHIKLFYVMGGNLIVWIIWMFFRTDSTLSTDILMLAELLQCSLTAIIFLWKENVKRSIRKRFRRALAPGSTSLSTLPSSSY
ncbi:G-protein coupled receptor Mth2-like [Athalia rosae]|uniref:G-protein coupled receptor Mth2-like n=1 Tax=Athalia rosae TaxID=37344 RepID=UPI0020335265|nr:G-protein coupled receptor Mth2-like [Athalia rosae]